MINRFWSAIIIPFLMLFGGCQTTGTQTAIVEIAVRFTVADLCTVAEQQFAKVGNPTTVQTIAMAKARAACADPAVTAKLIVAAYNDVAVTIGASKAKLPSPTASTTAPVILSPVVAKTGV